MSDLIQNLDTASFNATVRKPGLAVVDFYSQDCAPCAALAPKYEAMAKLYGSEVRFYKVFRQENRELAQELGVRSSPTVLFLRDGEVVGDLLSGGVQRSEMMRNLDALVGPESAARIRSGIEKKETSCDILILGGGPAGLAAAIYAAQAKRHVILVDTALPGGQIKTTHQVSNYPGFVEPQSGMMLGYAMFEQALKAGTEMRVAVEVNSVDLDAKTIQIDGHETLRGRRLILATGSSPRALNIPGEKEYFGKGIHYCATCDGKYYEGKELVVIGGGNSAVEESLFLTQFASKVTIVHQFDELQANKVAQEMALNHPKIEFRLSHEPRAFRAREGGMDVEVEDMKAGKTKVLNPAGVFVFVGMVPNLDLFGTPLNKDPWGYVITDEYMRTNVPGVFAVGDIAQKPIRQITVATAEGTIAGVQAAREVDMELRQAVSVAG